MIINLRSRVAKLRAALYINRQMENIEKSFALELQAALNKQYEYAAQFAEMGDLHNIDYILQLTNEFFLKIYKKKFKTIYSVFGDIIFNNIGDEDVNKNIFRLETKTMKETYVRVMLNWINSYVGSQITMISRVTKKKIQNIIETAMTEGKSNNETAKNIRKVKPMNKKRAITIARTETHTAASKSMHEAFNSTGLDKEREWFAVGDKRTREAHIEADGQRVKGEEPFFVGGEYLKFPGDPSASAKNIVRCRCVELFHTV